MKRLSPQYYDYLNVPIALCVHSLKERKINQVRLYLYLKSISNGYIKNDPPIFKKAALELRVCIKTIRNHRDWLLKEGWIIHDSEVNSIRIISFKLLAVKLEFPSASGVIIYKSDIKDFKGIAIAAIIEYYMMRSKRRNKVTELEMWNSQFPSYLRYPHLAHSYLAKVLNKSKSAIYKYKKHACNKRQIKTKKKYLDLQLAGDSIVPLKEHGPLNPDNLKQRRGTILYQLPDEIHCHVKLRRKDDLRNICQKNRQGKIVHH
jgi:hypothetical protein